MPCPFDRGLGGFRVDVDFSSPFRGKALRKSGINQVILPALALMQMHQSALRTKRSALRMRTTEEAYRAGFQKNYPDCTTQQLPSGRSRVASCLINADNIFPSSISI